MDCKNCKNCKSDGNQMWFPSKCTGCGAHGEGLHFEAVSNLNNIKDLEQLHAMIEAALRTHGNMLVNVSVLQETPNNPHGTYFEDRAISADSTVVTVDSEKLFELYV